VSGWRCYFNDGDGVVLRTLVSWDTPEEAAMWGQSWLRGDEELEVEDPRGEVLSASAIDAEAGLTVERDDD
jgi:hypothetical protein